MKPLKASLRALLVFTLGAGLLYPLLVTAMARTLFPHSAAGSLVTRDSKVIGSELIAQKSSGPRFFQPRPSASDYGTTPSGASNLGPISAKLKEEVDRRLQAWGPGAPSDLLTASGSGLDPHISRQAVEFQLAQIAKARSLAEAELAELRAIVLAQMEPPTFGVLGQERANVLRLNMILEERYR